MKKIDKLIVMARIEAMRKDDEEIAKVFSKMTTEQLQELAFGDPDESRVRDILAAVDGLHLLESG